MSSMSKMFAVVTIGLVLLAYPVQSKALNGVVPGKSLGRISIGESRGDVLTSMNIEPTNHYEFKGGLSEDIWIIAAPNNRGATTHTSVSVWYLNTPVVQIELSSTNDGLRLASFNSLIAKDPNLKRSFYNIDCYNSSGEWAGGCVQCYYDDFKKGIAYGVGLQDALVLERKPDCIIIHTAGKSVIPISDTSKAKLLEHTDNDVFRTFADQNKYEMAQARAYQLKAKVIKPATAHRRKHHATPDVAVASPKFPFRWGQYTIKVTKSGNASSDLQSLSIYNATGKMLWKTDADHNADFSLCSITGSPTKELEITPMIEGTGGNGTDYYFSRQGGLYLLFSYEFGDSDGIIGFVNFDHATRPEVEVDHSIVDFDDFAHGQRQVFCCIYKWDGNQYVNATAAFPHNALAAASIAKAAYLRHWQNNPKADYLVNDETEGADSADRVDAIGYWANAMAVGQGDIAKSWLLDHANPQLALHLLRIEKELQKQITPQGEPLGLSIGNGKNLDPSFSR